MKKRLMKKVLSFGPNHRWSHTKMMLRMFNRLRPPYINEQGHYTHPSCHDIPIVAHAWTKAKRLIRKHGSVYKKRNFPKTHKNRQS